MFGAIRKLTLTPETAARMSAIGRACFGPHYSEKLFLANWTLGHPETAFFGAFAGDELIAFNGFLAHRVLIRGGAELVFQSCHSATDPAHRGKGLFTSIIDHAKTALKDRGHYIIGYPNNQSGPIFLNRLAFRLAPVTRVLAPCYKASTSLFDPDLYLEALDDPLMIRFDQHAAADWKSAEVPGSIVECNYLTNFLWGCLVRKRLPIGSVSLFVVGGCEINKPQLFGRTLAEVGRKSGATLARFVCTKDSPIARASRWRLSGRRTEPLIWFPLRDAAPAVKFDAHTGVKDVFGHA